MNFFTWIRDGVRHAVLEGVHEAVDALGTPSEKNDIREHLATALQADGSGTSTRRVGGSTKRKKLGRSLNQIQADKKAS